MKINEWDAGGANARQWNVTPGHHSVSSVSDWVRGSPIPALFRNEIGFKTIKVALLIYGDGREDILKNCGAVLSHLLEPVNLELDGFVHKFYGVLTKHTLEENPLGIPFVRYNRASELTLEFDCFEYSTQEDGSPFSVSANSARTVLVNNPGTLLTPAVIELRPQIGAASVTMNGICRDTDTGKDLPVTVRELTAGTTVILDGETGLITQNGKLKAEDTDIWALPALLPGTNRITVNRDGMSLTVRFRPRFM